MNSGYMYSSLCKHISRHRTIYPSGKQQHSMTACSNRKAAGSFNVFPVDISLAVTDFHSNRYLRIINVHLKIVKSGKPPLPVPWAPHSTQGAAARASGWCT